MEASELILTDGDAEASADELLSALTDLAYATPSAMPKPEPKRRRSRFFFRLTGSVADDVKARSTKFKPKQMVHIDEEVEKRLKVYRSEVPAVLSQNINQVREFFLTEIGPLSLASGAGAGQAREIVQRMLNTEIDGTQFDKFDRMSRAAVNIVMAKFVARYYGLPLKDARNILSDIMPRQPTIVQVPPSEPYESRHARGRKEHAEARKEIADKGKEQGTPQ